MPFEPRLIHGDDEDNRELPLPGAQLDDLGDLPDDLAELANQLEADAGFLSQRFPAGECQPAKQVGGRPRRWLAGLAEREFWFRAAAVALLAVTLGAMSWQDRAGKPYGKRRTPTLNAATPNVPGRTRPRIRRRPPPKVSGPSGQ